MPRATVPPAPVRCPPFGHDIIVHRCQRVTFTYCRVCLLIVIESTKAVPAAAGQKAGEPKLAGKRMTTKAVLKETMKTFGPLLKRLATR